MSRTLLYVRRLIAIGSVGALFGTLGGGCASGGEANTTTHGTGGSAGGVQEGGDGTSGFTGTGGTGGTGLAGSGGTGAIGGSAGAPTDSGLDADASDGNVDSGTGGSAGATGTGGSAGTGAGGCASKPEICNGLDDNCNGQIDEPPVQGVGDACKVSGKQGVCVDGTQQCINGALTCVQNNQPSAEICDGLDNNCNGTVDEGNPGGNQPCPTGKPGVCGAGTTACVNGKIVCNQNITASPEVCNGLDDNCDGIVDNNPTDVGGSCDTGKLGVCAAGTYQCQNGQRVCVQNVKSSSEVCNGKDDDCNGTIDDPSAVNNQPCNTGQFGVCAAGTTLCVNGQSQCNPIKTASAELCNGLDDNCNGQTDEAPPNTMCSTQYPNAAHVASWGCTAGTCQITQCATGYVNSDGVLGNGCETFTCVDQPTPNQCSGATSMSVPSSKGGQLRTAGETVWFKVTFTKPAAGTTFAPTITLTQGTGEYEMDVLSDCSTAVVCPATPAWSGGTGTGETTSGANVDSWSMNFNQNPNPCGGTNGACSYKSAVPSVLYIRVKRVSVPSGGECDPFQVAVSQ